MSDFEACCPNRIRRTRRWRQIAAGRIKEIAWIGADAEVGQFRVAAIE